MQCLIRSLGRSVSPCQSHHHAWHTLHGDAHAEEATALCCQGLRYQYHLRYANRWDHRTHCQSRMNAIHFEHNKSYEHHEIVTEVRVYPPHPDNKFPRIDKNGEKFDTYYLCDTMKSWRKKPDWKRIVRYNGKRIDHVKQLPQWQQDILQEIKKNYPLPTFSI